MNISMPSTKSIKVFAVVRSFRKHIQRLEGRPQLLLYLDRETNYSADPSWPDCDVVLWLYSKSNDDVAGTYEKGFKA